MKTLQNSKLMQSVTAATAALLMLLSGIAVAQEALTPAERRMQIASPPDEVLLFEDERKQVVDYKSDRMIRVCVSENRHLVPLAVIYDGERSNVAPGDCIRIEARKVELTPARELDEDWAMRAEVQTMS